MDYHDQLLINAKAELDKLHSLPISLDLKMLTAPLIIGMELSCKDALAGVRTALVPMLLYPKKTLKQLTDQYIMEQVTPWN
jgi:hypothetical protein